MIPDCEGIDYRRINGVLNRSFEIRLQFGLSELLLSHSAGFLRPAQDERDGVHSVLGVRFGQAQENVDEHSPQ